jgi:hypothetical protein
MACCRGEVRAKALVANLLARKCTLDLLILANLCENSGDAGPPAVSSVKQGLVEESNQ